MAYSFHLGSDKNRKSISKSNGKNNISVHLLYQIMLSKMQDN